jgi:hypothetical protein
MDPWRKSRAYAPTRLVVQALDKACIVLFAFAVGVRGDLSVKVPRSGHLDLDGNYFGRVHK